MYRQVHTQETGNTGKDLDKSIGQQTEQMQFMMFYESNNNNNNNKSFICIYLFNTGNSASKQSM